MRRVLFPAALILAASVGVGQASAVTVETNTSAEFQEKLEQDYGVRESQILSDYAERSILKAFEREGVDAERVVITIRDARPNRPTLQQVSDRIGLDSMRSISTGGAHLSGAVYNASGTEIAQIDYDWFETDIRQAVGVGTWHDARGSIRKFARRLAKSID